MTGLGLQTADAGFEVGVVIRHYILLFLHSTQILGGFQGGVPTSMHEVETIVDAGGTRLSLEY